MSPVIDERKRELIGSPSRDIFKHAHKLLPSNFYACDLDFVLVAKSPNHIVAFIDYKREGDKLTFAEVIAFNQLREIAPVFIIQGNDPEFGPFDIHRYEGGDSRPEPPKPDLTFIQHCETYDDLGEWEQELRRQQ